jgi:CDP-diacylglycerol--glycerol-3-phosphate 3-phosphatidyltransferase
LLFYSLVTIPLPVLVNLPNSITLTRIASVPVLIWALSPHFHLPAGLHFPPNSFLAGSEQELIASTVFILASITDGLDGYLARRRGQITTLGMLLDPLADKLMVTAAFILLVAYNPRVMHPWIAVLVIGREFLVSGLRSIATSEGFTIEASDLGKLKTVIQIVSVVAITLNHRWDYWNLWGFPVGVHLIAVTAMYWMTVVSIISAVDYFIGFWNKIDHASTGKRKRRSSVLSRRRAKQTPVPPSPSTAKP